MPHIRIRRSLLVMAALAAPLAAQDIPVVRPGQRGLLRAAMPLGSDTVDNYVREGGVERMTGTTVRTITGRRVGGEAVYEIRTLHWLTGADTSVTTMTVRAADLSLVSHKVKAPRDSAAVTAADGHLTAWVVLPNQPIRLLDRALEAPVFGVEGQVPWLLPLLPLAREYRAAVPHYSPWAGAESFDTLTVTGTERVVIGVRVYDCWVVDAGPLGPPGYRMVRWIHRTSRRVVQSVLRGEGAGPEYWSRLRS